MPPSALRRAASVLAVSLFLAVVTVWIPFLHLHLLNAANLTLPLSAHVPLLALVSAIVAGAALVLQAAAPARLRTAVSGVLLFCGVAAWAEGTLLVGRFGFLQGGEIDWAANRGLLLGELAVAAAFGALAWRLRGRLVHGAPWLALLLTVSALANLYPAWAARRAAPDAGAWTFTREGLFRLSPERNVLVFVIDTFQSDVFAEIVAEEPRWREVLDGFTYFPDATSGFPKTYASIPNLLTGQAFDNSRPFGNYLREAYLGGSAPRVLKQHGYDARYRSFTWQPYLAHPDVADNLAGPGTGASPRWMKRREFTQLANLVLFRLAPFAAKPWVYNDNQFRLDEVALPAAGGAGHYALNDSTRVYSRGNRNADLEFLDRSLAYLAADGAQPTFRVFHLMGTHPPFDLARDLAHVENQPLTRASYRAQATAMLELMRLVLERLRALGVYDCSQVFVIGDHGAGEVFDVGQTSAPLAALGWDRGPLAATDPQRGEVVRGGSPLLLVKPTGAGGPLALSRAPVELADIPATILREAGLEGRDTGPSLFSVPADAPRERIHRFYKFAGWGQDYIVPMTEFRVDGFAWDPASWSETGRDLNRVAMTAVGGRMIIFGESGNLDLYDHSGWSPAGFQGRTSEYGDGSLVTPLEPEGGPYEMVVRVKRLQAAPEPFLVRAFVNDTQVALWTVASDAPNRSRLWTLVPEHVTRGRAFAEVRFEVGGNPDHLLFVEIRLSDERRPADYTPGHELQFTGAGDGQPYLGHGWAPPEAWGTWSLGRQGMLYLGLPADLAGPLTAEIVVSPALFPGAEPVRATITANGFTIGEIELARRGERTLVLPIPAEAVADSRLMALGFEVHNPRAPSTLVGSEDPRRLGLGLVRLTVRPGGEDLRPDAGKQVDVFGRTPPSRRSGLHGADAWGTQPIVWSDGAAGFGWELPPGRDPVSVRLQALAGPPVPGPVVVCADGQVVGAGIAGAYPWTVRTDLSVLPVAAQLSLRIYSGTFVPAVTLPGSSDHRRLGLALSAVELESMQEAARPDSALALAPPPHLVLTPGRAAAAWTGIHAVESVQGEPLAWTDGLASCRAAWPGPGRPARLLLDIAHTGPAGTPLTVEINGHPVLQERGIAGSWSGLLDLAAVPAADSLTITIASDRFIPAEVDPRALDSRTLGVALRNVTLLGDPEGQEGPRRP